MTNCDPIEQLKDLVAAYGNPNDAEALDELASLRSQLSACQQKLAEATEHEIKLEADLDDADKDVTRLQQQLSECQRDLANGGMSEKRLRLKDMSARKLPFQSGDVVKTPRGTGTIEAIGQLGEGTVVYRVGKRQYWFSWQLLHVRRQI